MHCLINASLFLAISLFGITAFNPVGARAETVRGQSEAQYLDGPQAGEFILPRDCRQLRAKQEKALVLWERIEKLLAGIQIYLRLDPESLERSYFDAHVAKLARVFAEFKRATQDWQEHEQPVRFNLFWMPLLEQHGCHLSWRTLRLGDRLYESPAGEPLMEGKQLTIGTDLELWWSKRDGRSQILLMGNMPYADWCFGRGDAEVRFNQESDIGDSGNACVSRELRLTL